MEIGGYIEFEKYNRPMLHEEGIKLNCGRNALLYLIKVKNIKKIAMPKFMCDSCADILKNNRIIVRYYSIGRDFRPLRISLADDEWLYLVNFYGQLSNEYIKELVATNKRVIIDNAQAYFQTSLEGSNTLYTCRKFFGVADGAFLYTDIKLDEDIPQDESFDRMHFLLGRFERTASEFYPEYTANNCLFATEPLKRMSKLTENLLRGIDYESVKIIRTNNFSFLHKQFQKINKLNLKIPEGAFMYPLYIENGSEIRKQLQNKKIYIPTLWPAVFNLCAEDELEYGMAKNILPLPVDQRYSQKDMQYLVDSINRLYL